MLAQIAADAPAQVPLWLTLVLSALSAIGATGLTLIIGLWQLKEHETYRRAARWEPMAEQLWKDRFITYDRLMASVSDVVNAVSEEVSAESLEKAIVGFMIEQRRVYAFGGIKVADLTGPLSDAMGVFLTQARASGTGTITQEQMAVFKSAHTHLLLAIRIDLGIDALDEMSDHWYMRTQTQAQHDKFVELGSKMLRDTT